MKIAKKSRETLEALDAATRKNGHLDQQELKRELDTVIDAMREVNRKLDDLLAKARR